MAHIMAKRGSLDNVVTYEHYCDSIIDLENIPKEETTLGSVAIVVNDEDESIEVYIANSAKKWIPFSSVKSGGSDGENVSIEPITINENGVYTAEEGTAYSPITVDVSAGDNNPIALAKAVNFRDYDGTIRYSYTPEEFAELDSLPANPDHSGNEIPLTAQGWNWSLDDAKTYVAKYGGLEIGQMYITTDEKTHIKIYIDPKTPVNRMTFTLRWLQSVSNGVIVDWGDGSLPQTYEGTQTFLNDETAIHNHTYNLGGWYDITLTVVEGSLSFQGYNEIYSVCGRIEEIYSYNFNRIREIYLGNISNTAITDAFLKCRGLTLITIPNILQQNIVRTFKDCYSLKYLILPKNITPTGSICSGCYSLTGISIPNGATSFVRDFYNSFNLSSILIPENTTTIAEYTFYNCSNLTSMIIPSKVSGIGSYAFNSCSGISEYHLYPTTPPQLSATNAFSTRASDCIIYVPYSENHSILEAYKTATNWSAFADIIQEEPI